MDTLVIYFDEDKKSRQIVRPTNKFKPRDWKGLADAITQSNSNPSHGRVIKNYHHFEIM